MGVSSSTLYCNECGAALTTERTYCPFCNHRVDAVTPLTLQPISSSHEITLPPQPQSSPQSQPVETLHTNTVLNYRYVILEKVGEGGFGLVYKARDQQRRGRLVAVKQINLAALSPKEMIEATDSYNREIKLLPRLHHRNLPAFYDHFTDSSHWYVVMDFIEGITLEEYLQKSRGRRLSLKQVREVGLVLCNVLHYLHTQKPPIIFRDVKPANIMRTKTGRYYLIDFGIARQYVPGKGRDTGPLGSPGYAAPEQYGKAQTDERSDIYGLGSTLQTLITGEEPAELIQNVRAQKRLAKSPERLRVLLEQMLQVDSRQRPASMLEVSYRLERALPDRTVKRAVQSVAIAYHRIFNHNVLFWGLTIIMAWTVFVEYNTETLHYVLFLLTLLVGIGLRCLTEELEMQVKPLGRAEIQNMFRALLRQAELPVLGLTFFCWLYSVGSQEPFFLGWVFLYFLYYLGVTFAVVGFCFFALGNLLKQFFFLRRARNASAATKAVPSRQKYKFPLQQQMHNP